MKAVNNIFLNTLIGFGVLRVGLVDGRKPSTTETLQYQPHLLTEEECTPSVKLAMTLSFSSGILCNVNNYLFFWRGGTHLKSDSLKEVSEELDFFYVSHVCH